MMMAQNNIGLNELNSEIIACRLCPRLVEWRETVARVKRKAFKDCDYWGKPVPGFGDIDGRILVIGLAPGAHGSNRTGRMFTGDASGNFLFHALFKAGFANQAVATSIEDGLELNNVFISATCRCAPPNNKPTSAEIYNCRPFLNREISLMKNLVGIVALGKIGFDSAVKLINMKFLMNENTGKARKFGHGLLYMPEHVNYPWLLSSYHPSQQNTQTGRLTVEMFQAIWDTAKRLI
jgi:uracil-DNA glycosylase family 4